MDHQIDMDKYIKLISEVDKLKVLEIEVIEKKQEQVKIERKLAFFTSEKEKALDELQALAGWRNKLFGGNKRKAKVQELEKNLADIEKDIEENKKQAEKLAEEISEKEKELQKLHNELQGFSYKGFEKIKDGLLVITDETVKELNPLFRNVQKKERIVSKDNIKEYALVHSTNFFPKDNKILCAYDGNKVGKTVIQYHGIEKEVKALIHRHTVHFTLNNIVESTGDGAGTWEQPEYIVVEPFNIHQKQFINYGVSNNYVAGDNFTWGSVDLEKPYYLVREDALNKIPREEREKGNIIVYRGDAGVCLRRFLKMLDYPIFGYEENNPSHANSFAKHLEDALNCRDLAVNYLQNNSFDGKEHRKFSLEDIKNILEIEKEYYLSYNEVLYDEQVLENIKKKGIPIDFAKAIVGSGIKIVSDGSFYFDSDENVYENICDNHKVDLANLEQIWHLYQSLEHTNDENRIISLEEIGQKTIKDLYLFENLDMLNAFLRQLEKIMPDLNNRSLMERLNIMAGPYISEDGFYLNVTFNINDPRYNFKYDNIKVADADDTLEVAYSKIQEYLNSFEYKLENDNLDFSRGSMNISYLLFTISLILIGIIISLILLK